MGSWDHKYTVGSGKSFEVTVPEGSVLLLGKARLEKLEGKDEDVCLYVTVDGKTYIVGNIQTAENQGSQKLNLVINKKCHISHNWSYGDVYFYAIESQRTTVTTLPKDGDEKSIGVPPSAARREFWAVEVKAGKPLTVKLADANFMQLHSVAIGEPGNTQDPFIVHIHYSGGKRVPVTLFPKRLTTQIFDLVILNDFKLSHNKKDGSVYLCGSRLIPLITPAEEEPPKKEEQPPKKVSSLKRTRLQTRLDAMRNLLT